MLPNQNKGLQHENTHLLGGQQGNVALSKRLPSARGHNVHAHMLSPSARAEYSTRDQNLALDDPIETLHYIFRVPYVGTWAQRAWTQATSPYAYHDPIVLAMLSPEGVTHG